MAGVAAVIVAAGRGVRAGGDMPKQFRPIGGAPMLRRSLLAFVEHPKVGAVQPVIHPEDVAMFQASAAGIETLPPVFGGATRQASVRAGLEALAKRTPDIVLVHDAARPFASATLVSRAIAAAEKTGAAIPALPVTDTVKTVDAAGLVGGRSTAARCAWCRRRRLSPSPLCSRPIAAPPPAAARISPTTPRLPNGPA